MQFVMVPFAVADACDTKGEINIYRAVRYFINGSNFKCFPSVREIAIKAKCCIRTAQKYLKSLAEKEIIDIERRKLPRGGYTSNLYTIYDGPGRLRDRKATKKTEVLSVAECIKFLKTKGFDVSKKDKGGKEVEADERATKKPVKEAPKKEVAKKETPKFEEKYSRDFLEELYQFEYLIDVRPSFKGLYKTIEEILYKNLNTSQPVIRVGRENMPAEIVKSKLLALDCNSISYAAYKYVTYVNESCAEIQNPSAYMLTVLYRVFEAKDLSYDELPYYPGCMK